MLRYPISMVEASLRHPYKQAKILLLKILSKKEKHSLPAAEVYFPLAPEYLTTLSIFKAINQKARVINEILYKTASPKNFFSKI